MFGAEIGFGELGGGFGEGRLEGLDLGDEFAVAAFFAGVGGIDFGLCGDEPFAEVFFADAGVEEVAAGMAEFFGFCAEGFEETIF